ncbi:MAG: 30S ribosomal protein S2, partial [Deltaproteobacteria bacterium]|nr:30S ribosomal protein S2 [Deltaproteobacteria bacterium]
AIQLFVSSVADACLEGKQLCEENLQAATDKAKSAVVSAQVEAAAS